MTLEHLPQNEIFIAGRYRTGDPYVDNSLFSAASAGRLGNGASNKLRLTSQADIEVIAGDPWGETAQTAALRNGLGHAEFLLRFNETLARREETSGPLPLARLEPQPMHLAELSFPEAINSAPTSTAREKCASRTIASVQRMMNTQSEKGDRVGFEALRTRIYQNAATLTEQEWTQIELLIDRYDREVIDSPLNKIKTVINHTLDQTDQLAENLWQGVTSLASTTVGKMAELDQRYLLPVEQGIRQGIAVLERGIRSQAQGIRDSLGALQQRLQHEMEEVEEQELEDIMPADAASDTNAVVITEDHHSVEQSPLSTSDLLGQNLDAAFLAGDYSQYEQVVTLVENWAGSDSVYMQQLIQYPLPSPAPEMNSTLSEETFVVAKDLADCLIEGDQAGVNTIMENVYLELGRFSLQELVQVRTLITSFAAEIINNNDTGILANISHNLSQMMLRIPMLRNGVNALDEQLLADVMMVLNNTINILKQQQNDKIIISAEMPQEVAAELLDMQIDNWVLPPADDPKVMEAEAQLAPLYQTVIPDNLPIGAQISLDDSASSVTAVAQGNEHLLTPGFLDRNANANKALRLSRITRRYGLPDLVEAGTDWSAYGDLALLMSRWLERQEIGWDINTKSEKNREKLRMACGASLYLNLMQELVDAPELLQRGNGNYVLNLIHRQFSNYGFSQPDRYQVAELLNFLRQDLSQVSTFARANNGRVHEHIIFSYSSLAQAYESPAADPQQLLGTVDIAPSVIVVTGALLRKKSVRV